MIIQCSCGGKVGMYFTDGLTQGVCPLCESRFYLTVTASTNTDAATLAARPPDGGQGMTNECECCKDKHGISSHFPAVFCGLCKHPILSPDGKRLYASFEAVHAWQEGKSMPTSTPAPQAEAVVRAAKELRQVWTDKGHGGNAEVEAHRKLAKAVDALAALEAGRK